MKFEIKNNACEIVLTIESDDTIETEMDKSIIQLTDGTELQFPCSVTVFEKSLPEDYSDTFVIDIGDDVRDAIVESLEDRGVEHDLAYEIASNMDQESINVEVYIQPKHECAEINDVCTY